MEPMRLAVVTAIPTPYRDPFWNEVARLPGVELDVYYCSAIKADQPWMRSWEMRYHSEFLPTVNLARLLPGGVCWWNPAIGSRLQAGKYDALVVGGYNHPTMIAAMMFARRHRVPYFLMSESYLSQPRTWWRRLVKTPLVRWVVGGATGCFPTGSRAREYLLHYGAPADRQWFLPNVPDVEALDTQAQELLRQRPALRAKLRLGDKPVVLYVGRLVRMKRVDLLVRAFARVAAQRQATLVILGDGTLQRDLQSLAESLGIADFVRFVGFLDPREVPRWHAAADLMVLPSVGETWSVALIEALASNLPVVTTDLVGAGADVLNHPLVGTVVPAGSEEALAKAIADRLMNPTNRHHLREVWKPVREELRHEVVARRTVEAIRLCIGREKPAETTVFSEFEAC